MGEQAFMSALKTYAAENYLKIATKEDFVTAMQAANPNADIQAVFARYFNE